MLGLTRNCVCCVHAANKLADQLINANLAACVNIVPGLTSVYKWEGKIEHDQELLLVIKTKE